MSAADRKASELIKIWARGSGVSHRSPASQVIACLAKGRAPQQPCWIVNIGAQDALVHFPDHRKCPVMSEGGESTAVTEGLEVAEQVRLVEKVAKWLRSVRASVGPDPQSADSIPEFVAAMNSLRAWAGNPTFRQLEKRAGTGRLPRATVSLALRSTNRLPKIELVTEFVKACGATAALPAWVATWYRLHDGQAAARWSGATA